MAKGLEVYIGNEMLDIDEKFVFALEFMKLNFEDFTVIGGARTTTITFLDTEKNRKILGYSNNLGSETDIPYTQSECVVKLNGIELDGKALVAITGFSNGGFGGNVFMYRANLNTSIGNKNLQELDLGTQLAVNSNQNYSDDSQDYINAFFDMQGGEGVGAGFQWWFLLKRSWKLRRLFEQIFIDAGYTVDTLPASLDWLETHYLQGFPEYTSIEAAHKEYQDESKGLLSRTTDYQVDAGSPQTTYDIIVSFDDIASQTPSNFTNTYAILSNVYTYKLKASISGVYGRATAMGVKDNNVDCFVWLGYATNNADPLGTFVEIGQSAIDNGTQTELGTTLSGAVTNNRVYVKVRFVTGVGYQYFGVETGSFFSIEVGSYIPESIYTWIFAQDLPNQLQKSLIKSVLLLSASSINYDSYTNTILIESLEDILEQTPVDWTDKIDFDEEPSTAFTGQYAQKNYIKFKGSEIGQIVYNVNNVNLPDSRNLEADFARVDNNVGDIATVDTRKQKLKASEMQFIDETVEASFDQKQNQFHLFSDREQKKQDAFIGTIFPYPAAFIYRVPVVVDRDPPNNPIYVSVNAEYVANVFYFKALQSLSQFQGNADLIASKLASKYKRSTFRAFLSALDLANLPNVVYVGGSINQRFLLVSVRNWTASDEPCEIELLKIQNN